MTNRWRLFSVVLLVVAMIEFALLIREGGGALLTATSKTSTPHEDGFEAFEGISFAREFSERLASFDSRSFKPTQSATAFLFDEDERSVRLIEIDRLAEKIERRDVNQKAHLTELWKIPGEDDRFRADLEVDLTEGSGVPAAASHFVTRLEFAIARTIRSEQNPWGFHVRDFTQKVIQPELIEAAALRSPTFFLRPKVATLIRFPCSVENVELPKATSIRVKLTTLDISELQVRTETALNEAQTIRAVCRDRVFTMRIEAEKDAAAALVVFKSLTLANSTLVSLTQKKSKKQLRNDVRRSIEDQLGFVVEEE